MNWHTNVRNTWQYLSFNITSSWKYTLFILSPYLRKRCYSLSVLFQQYIALVFPHVGPFRSSALIYNLNAIFSSFRPYNEDRTKEKWSIYSVSTSVLSSIQNSHYTIDKLNFRRIELNSNTCVSNSNIRISMLKSIS